MTNFHVPNNNFRGQIASLAAGAESFTLPVGTIANYQTARGTTFQTPTYLTLWSAGLQEVDADPNEEVVDVASVTIGGGVGGGDLVTLETPTVNTHTGATYVDGENNREYLTELQAAVSAQPPTAQYFSGDGSTTVYTLSFTPRYPAALMVLVQGVGQRPSGIDYTYSGTGPTVTFTTPPPQGASNIQVWGM